MGKRLFLAVDIDEPAREAIGRISSDVQHRLDPRVKMSWVKPTRLHLTLHFFGDSDASAEETIGAALKEPIRKAPFNVSFDGLGVFPERGRPRVLWLGIRDGAEDLRMVHKLALARVKVQLKPDPTLDQSFKPHLTLARFRERVPRGEISEILAISASAGPSRIDRVTLYESCLSPAGPTYCRLAEALLMP